MKKFILILMTLSVAAFYSCEKTETNCRDQVTGVYSGTSTSNISSLSCSK